MKFKVVFGRYIIGVGTGAAGIEISEQEYESLTNIIHTRPVVEGYISRLRAETLEWELVKIQPIEPEPLTDEEALTRYANTITGANDPDLISAAETLIEQRIKEE